MSILEKVRDFFYDDEYEEDVKKELKPAHKDKKSKLKKEPKFEEEQEISERELFKAERTFNFPFDVEDEEDTTIFKEEEKPIEKTVEIKVHKEDIVQPVSIRNYSPSKEEKEEVEVKKFKPTPVISPIYGILDKNYKKEDLIIDSAKEKEETKKLDYDTVRRRAYSNVYTDEGTQKDDEKDSKGIFFNLDEEKKDDDVKIVYNDVEFEEEPDDKTKTIGEKIEEYEKSLEKEKEEVEDTEDQILSETKEQDLFNLIDNMYNSDEEDEEEVEE